MYEDLEKIKKCKRCEKCKYGWGESEPCEDFVPFDVESGDISCDNWMATELYENHFSIKEVKIDSISKEN